MPAASRSGTMCTDQMLRYIRLVLAPRVDRFRQADGSIAPTLLLMDNHRAHLTDEVFEALQALNIDHLLIPSDQPVPSSKSSHM